MATYYWVGGSGTWDNTSNTNWSATSGGAGGAGVPNNADTVNFDANSGTAATVTVAATATCLACTINKSDINLSLSGSPTFAGNTTLTTGTVTLNTYTLTVARFLSANTNTRTVDFGTGKIALSGDGAAVWANATLTGMTYSGTPVIDLTYSGAVGTRTVQNGSSGGTGNEGNAISVNVVAGSDTVTLTSSVANAIKNLNFTGFSGTLTNGARTIYGNLTLVAGMTLPAGTNATTFGGTSGTKTITSAGQTMDFPLTLNGAGSAWELTDALTIGSSRAFTLTNGTFDSKGYNVTLGTFALGAGTKTLTIGSSTWTVLGATWNANSNSTGLTLSASTGTLSMTSASAKTFSGGGLIWPTLNQGGAGALTIAQSNTFANITDTVQPATIRFTAGTTQTVNAFNASGTAGNQITLDSSSAGSLATLNGTGGIVNLRYVNIKDIRAQGYTEWNALVDQGAVDQGNTPGWNFITLGVKKILRRVFGKQIIRPVIEEIS